MVLKNIWFKYPVHKKGLKNIDMTISRSEVIGLHGPNGSGKSSILRSIIGSFTPTRGDIIMRVSENCRISYVPQNPVLTLLAPTVKDCIELLALRCKIPRSNLISAAKLLGLDEYFETSILNLSLGMWRRLALALALGCRAELTLLDEPTPALDPETSTHSLSI